VGYEVNLLYIACLVALVLGGSGPLAIDGLIGQHDEVQIRNRETVPSDPR
jgi:putative oxidoreductase